MSKHLCIVYYLFIKRFIFPIQKLLILTIKVTKMFSRVFITFLYSSKYMTKNINLFGY